MKQLTDEVFAQVKEALQTAFELDPETDDGDTYYSNALAALDTAQPVPEVNARLVELLTPALPDIQDAVTCLNMWARGECLYAPKNGYEDPETRKATIKDVVRSAATLAPRLLSASRAVQDALVSLTAAQQAQPEQPEDNLSKLLRQVIYGDFSGDNPDDLRLALAARAEYQAKQAQPSQYGSPELQALILDKLQQAQPERAPLSADAYEALVDDLGEWSRYVVEDTAHITLDTHIRRTLTVHGIKQGGQHE